MRRDKPDHRQTGLRPGSRELGGVLAQSDRGGKAGTAGCFAILAGKIASVPAADQLKTALPWPSIAETAAPARHSCVESGRGFDRWAAIDPREFARRLCAAPSFGALKLTWRRSAV
jgi:hypothetical protein